MTERPMAYERYLSIIHRLDEIVGSLEQHPDEQTRTHVVALLSAVDALHREGLEQMVGRLRDFSGDVLVEHLLEDPVVATLLGLYGLAELDVPEEPEEPPAPADEVGFVRLEDVGIGKRAPASGEGRGR